MTSTTSTTITAACARDWVDPLWWFSCNTAERYAAKAVCAGCPMAQACLELALTAEGTVPARYRHGIYAGTTGVERWRISVSRSAAPTDPLSTPPAVMVAQ
jgi:hypothetical protein